MKDILKRQMWLLYLGIILDNTQYASVFVCKSLREMVFITTMQVSDRYEIIK